MRTYEAGEIPRLIMTEFRKEDSDYSSYGAGKYVYYSNKNKVKKLFEDAILTRIFAEEEMIFLEESGSKRLNALWDKVGIGAGKNRKEIIADCKEMIEKLNKILAGGM